MTNNDRQCWLWVTHPEYYANKDGSDREDLDPNSGVASDGWWTCHKETRKGDLVLLWRTSPKRDIGYLIQAESEAYSIAEDPRSSNSKWEYACDCQVLYKFNNPITIKDIKDSHYFDDWGAYRGNFQGSYFRIPIDVWCKLNNFIADKNPGYLKFIKLLQKEPIAEFIQREEELQDILAKNLGILKKFGWELELYFDPETKLSGREFVCRGNGGRIDLLCYDKKHKLYLVIELKNVKAGQNTFGQIANYVGWVQTRIAGNRRAEGLVISRGYDVRFESALKVTDKISHLDIEDLGFK